MSDSRVAVHDFALFGAAPAFESILPVGQLYFPSWERYEAAFRGIFERRVYSGHGPLARELEARLAEFFRVKHVICVTNATIGLIMAAEALELHGRVIVPAFTFIASPQSLTWAGLEPRFCDVDPISHHVTPALVEPLIDKDVSAILAVNLWGGACDVGGLQVLADRRGVKLFYDSAHAFGCRVGDTPLASFGSLEVFSFHATKVFSSAEGGCICTNDDALAARLRRLRGSSGSGTTERAARSADAPMSEAQAAIGLMSLEDFPAIVARNKALFDVYRTGLAAVPGLRLLEAQNVSATNYQYLVCELDEPAFGLSRDGLLQVLKAENVLARRYFYPGAHRCVPYVDALPQYVHALPETDRLCGRLIQLPVGALVSDHDATRVCELIAAAQRFSREIGARLSPT